MKSRNSILKKRHFFSCSNIIFRPLLRTKDFSAAGMQSFHWQSALVGGVALAAGAKLYGELFANRSKTASSHEAASQSLEISQTDEKELKVRPTAANFLFSFTNIFIFRRKYTPGYDISLATKNLPEFKMHS